MYISINKTHARRALRLGLSCGFAAALLIAAGCSSSGDGDGDNDGSDTTTDGSDGGDGSGDGTDIDGSDGGDSGSAALAFVSGSTPTVDSSQIERLTFGETIESTGSLPATDRDITVATDGSSVYQIGRRNFDTLTKFGTDDLTTPVYQYSLADGDNSPNLQAIAFAGPNKAYISQYDNSELLIVNPAAETEADFRLGSIDLSAYDDDAPNATGLLIQDGRLYVLMERLTVFNPDKPGYVAVFDVATDTEIETGLGADGLAGIQLSTINPTGMQYVESSDEILVVGRGNVFVEFNNLPGDPYQGGLETISLDNGSFVLTTLLDDGSEADNNGFFSHGVVVNGDRGYIISSNGFDNDTLFAFNPLTGVLNTEVVAGLTGMSLRGLAVGPQGRLWVARGDMAAPGYTLIDPASNTVAVDLVATQFIPSAIVFVE